MGPKALTAFTALKQRFTEAPILQHYDLALQVQLETNASSEMAPYYILLKEDDAYAAKV
ncbi:hypothetical protein VE02_09064 [Pseudogymnoascus sp. 03VT05]|nr:hypothetical protein VE02_09064 [Pseudogymnoascus sp. 03VT05]